MIYLIGETGAARTTDEAMARAIVRSAGYRRCTEATYWQKMREIEAVDGFVLEQNDDIMEYADDDLA